jgi:hypothetical protein
MGAAVNLLIGGPSLVYCVIFALLRTDLVERVLGVTTEFGI